MTLQDLTSVAEILASLGVVVSFFFVAYQIRQNTSQLQRNEHNSTMQQWSTIRMVVIENRDVAGIWKAGLQGERELDAVDQLRLETLLLEHLWAAYQVWERSRRGVFTSGTFRETVAPAVSSWLSTPGGGAWWSGAKRGFPAPFVAEIDAGLTKPATAAKLT